jgi:transcriptional regulator with XRE-family HTH domain
MDEKQAQKLGKMLQQSREAQGLSAREVATRSGLVASSVRRLEQGAIPNPGIETLKSLASVLDLDASDLYATAGVMPTNGLPSFAPYLRSKYSDLPDSAQAELEKTFARIAAKHGYDPDGPKPGEDEAQ